MLSFWAGLAGFSLWYAGLVMALGPNGYKPVRQLGLLKIGCMFAAASILGAVSMSGYLDVAIPPG